MSNVLIFSDNGSFEENLFFVSQAQRFLVRAILRHEIPQQPWIMSYAEELSLDSWNNELKSFYLRSEEGYFDKDKSSRAALMLSILENAAIELRNMNYDEFSKSLLELNNFDLIDGNIDVDGISKQFLPDLKVVDGKMALNRIYCIILNVVRFLQNYKESAA